MDILEKFTIYLKGTARLKNATIKNYHGDILQFLNWIEQEKRISVDRITSEEILGYLQSSTLSQVSKQRHVSSLRKFFTFLKTQRLITASPFEHMQVKTQQQEDMHLQEFRHYLVVYNASHLTVKYYILDIKHFYKWIQNEKHIKILTETIIQEYKEYLKHNSNYAESTINRKYAAVRKYYAWLQA